MKSGVEKHPHLLSSNIRAFNKIHNNRKRVITLGWESTICNKKGPTEVGNSPYNDLKARGLLSHGEMGVQTLVCLMCMMFSW